MIGPAADLALLFTVPCTQCTPVAWGYNSPCQPSACSPASPPESMIKSPVSSLQSDSVGSSSSARFNRHTRADKPTRPRQVLPQQLVWPVTTDPPPQYSDSCCSYKGCFYPLPSDQRGDPRSSDLNLATCRGRLTTSASRPRIPEPKPTRHNAIQPCRQGRDSVNHSTSTHYDVDNCPRSSPRFLTADRGTPAQGVAKGLPPLALCRAVSPTALLAAVAVCKTHGRGRMSGSVSKPSRKNSGGQHTNSKVVLHSGHRDSPLFVSLSPRVGPLLSVGVSAMAPKFQPENETAPGRRTPTRQGSSFNSRNSGSRRDFSPFLSLFSSYVLSKSRPLTYQVHQQGRMQESE